GSSPGCARRSVGLGAWCLVSGVRCRGGRAGAGFPWHLTPGTRHLQFTTHPSLSSITRLPYPAFVSEWVTCTIVVPARFSSVNSSLYCFTMITGQYPVGS